MSGTIGLSLTQRYDKTSHLPLDGGKIYFYAAGTSTPQNAYQDTSLTIPWPNYLTLDSGGNVPFLWFADGYIKFRIANSAGVTQVEADYVPVMGFSDGEAAAPSVDATTIYQTGDIKVRYGTGTHDGWVRSNGRTIGSASSGATERANSDCQTLFEYLWGADANLSVSTGRGASANADWVANKNIALPDWRGRVISALDDMGNTAAGRRTTTYTGVAATVLGSVSTHGESHTLTAAQIPSITSANATQAISVTTTVPIPLDAAIVSNPGTGGPGSHYQPGILLAATSTGNNSISVTSNNTSGAAHSVVDPTMFATIYMKL